MIHLIKQIIKEELNSSYGFFKNKTSIPYFDSILSNQLSNLPEKYHDWYGEIKFLSAEEYINECAKLQGTSYQQQFKFILKSKVEDIKENMSNGVKYDMPYLNYVDKEQEGRHRVIAANELNQNKIPVLCLYQDVIQNNNNISDMIGKWNDLIKINDSYYVKFNNYNQLLSCIAKDYDYYYLHAAFDVVVNKTTPLNFVKRKIQMLGIQNSFNDGYINDKFIENLSKNKIPNDTINVLRNAVGLKTIYHNISVLEDCLKFDNNNYYLKLLDKNLYDNFDNYQNAKEMLFDNVKHKDYINEYNLLNLEDFNQLYNLNDNDVKTILKLL
jgi:hypothetical protein